MEEDVERREAGPEGKDEALEDDLEGFNLQGEFQEDDITCALLSGGPNIIPRTNSNHDDDDEDTEGDEDDVDGLEYEYEPGISLGNLEFARNQSLQPSHRRCAFCGVNYETGESMYCLLRTKPPAHTTHPW